MGLAVCRGDKILQRMAVNDLTLSVQGAYNGIFAEVAAATTKSAITLSCSPNRSPHSRRGLPVDLAEFKKRGKRTDNDKLIPAYDAMMEAIDALVTDAETLFQAAVEGKLATRADATKHQGDYRKIVEGVNDTLDAVIGPLNVSADYVDQISKGDIPAKITDNYNGDFNTIKNNLNPASTPSTRWSPTPPAEQGGGRRQAGDPRRCQQASGRLPQDRRRRQRNAGRGCRSAEGRGGNSG